jgi:hypothetical protein
MEGNELTFGQKAVGITFNPGGNPKVNEVKELYAKVIDLCNDIRIEAGKTGNPEMARLLSVAITEAQGAQMWAVKGITWQPEVVVAGGQLGASPSNGQS